MPSTSPTTPRSRPASATPCGSRARSRRQTRSPPTCWKASTRPTACRCLTDHRYARSGLAATKDRIAALSPADLHAQLARISRALSETIHSRYATEPEHAAHTELDVTSPDFLVDHALWIARELLD